MPSPSPIPCPVCGKCFTPRSQTPGYVFCCSPPCRRRREIQRATESNKRHHAERMALARHKRLTDPDFLAKGREGCKRWRRKKARRRVIPRLRNWHKKRVLARTRRHRYQANVGLIREYKRALERFGARELATLILGAHGMLPRR